MNLTFKEYYDQARSTAVYKDTDYPLYGLVEEVGELFGKLSKFKRGDNTFVDPFKVAYELGDVLWMLTNVAHEYGWRIDDIASMNIKKLKDRKDRGVLQGEGDDR